MSQHANLRTDVLIVGGGAGGPRGVTPRPVGDPDHFAALAGTGLPVIAYNAPRNSNPITALTKLHSIRPGAPAVKEVLAQRQLSPPYGAPPSRRRTPAESVELKELMSPHEDQLIQPTNGTAWVLS